MATMMGDHLPQEVLFDVFLKLPLKTLLLCTCVSKSWRSIITHPAFISSHLTRSASKSTSDRLLLIRRCYGVGFSKDERYTLHFDTETLDFCRDLKFPFLNWNQNFRIVGYCNGLLCLSGYGIVLWNPSIQRFVPVPCPRDELFTSRLTPYKHALGFGYDSRLHDFKVIRLVYPARIPPTCHVYELRTGRWREISGGAPPCEIVKSQWTQAFVNQGVHWVAYSESHRGFRCLILRFDVVDELFTIMPLPDCLINESPENLKITLLGGKLSVLQCGWYPFGNRFVSSVWTLESYQEHESWSRRVSVDPSQSHGLGMTLGCRENGEVLMASRNGELVLYSPETERVKGLGIRGEEDSFYVDSYVESLVVLNEGRGMLKEEAENRDWKEGF